MSQGNQGIAEPQLYTLLYQALCIIHACPKVYSCICYFCVLDFKSLISLDNSCTALSNKPTHEFVSITL